METEFVRDDHGEPIKAVMDYPDYLKIAKQLNLPLAPPNMAKERNPLDWYSLTESANSILNGLIALSSRERRLEMGKANPDQLRIDDLKRLSEEVWAINNNSENFTSLERMEEIINKYSPILLAEKKKIHHRISQKKT
ncbi:MAG TPA: hypothetical protein VFE53_24070 [Mucilaginibacter sp.]|jgi:hypothetical protein|nr:hypothetical protein [Mucilaginibacter sp.]